MVGRMKSLAKTILVLLLIFIGWSIFRNQPGVDNPPPDQQRESVDFHTLDGERSGKWQTVRNQFVEDNPECAACGSPDELNVHHIEPFHERPELELEISNLITLCREHHFTIGHDPDGDGPKRPNWKESNKNVVRDAKRFLQKRAWTMEAYFTAP